jgi:hypothetical protein
VRAGAIRSAAEARFHLASQRKGARGGADRVHRVLAPNAKMRAMVVPCRSTYCGSKLRDSGDNRLGARQPLRLHGYRPRPRAD